MRTREGKSRDSASQAECREFEPRLPLPCLLSSSAGQSALVYELWKSHLRVTQACGPNDHFSPESWCDLFRTERVIHEGHSMAVHLLDRGTSSPLERLVDDYLNHCLARGLSPRTLASAYGPALRSIFLPWCEQ